MRRAGAFVADVLAELVAAAAPGVNLLELDELAHRRIREAGATSCYIDYHPSFGGSPFGKVLCTSVNDAALHGLPHDYTLHTGDLLSVDFAVELGGWGGRFSTQCCRGRSPRRGPAPDRSDRGSRSEAGIAQAIPGNRLGDIQAAIGRVGARYGYPINIDFGGHGVGRTMHEEPSIPNDGEPGTGLLLKPGMVFAIEPWFMHGHRSAQGGPRWVDTSKRRLIPRCPQRTHRRHHPKLAPPY